MRYINEFIDAGAILTEKLALRLGVIRILFDQQWEMFEYEIQHVVDRIVRLQQPYIRPIQRGKAKAKVEFGAKIDASLSEGIVDIERFEFSAFNESKDFEAKLDH